MIELGLLRSMRGLRLSKVGVALNRDFQINVDIVVDVVIESGDASVGRNIDI